MATSVVQYVQRRGELVATTVDIEHEPVPLEEDERCIDPPCMVRKGLYISGVEAEHCKGLLKDRGITHILQVGSELRPSHPEHFVYKRLQVSDEEQEDLVGSFKEAFEFIDEARSSKGGAVLVHCAQGMSRSGTVVVGYLMWKERLSYVTALAHAQRARPVVEPNPGFALQLQDWEQSACELTRWTGWGQEKLERCFRRSSTSGRKVVHHFTDIIRRFHTHSLTDNDVVFEEHDTVLDL